MKKIFLIFTCLLTIGFNAVNAQCTPNLTGPYGQIAPDSATNLPHGMVGVTYDTDMQFWVPQDTVIFFIDTNTWSNYTLTSIVGLPYGFSYLCNPSDSVFPANAASCLHIHGIAPADSL